MKLAGEYLFDAPVPEVWNALFDPGDPGVGDAWLREARARRRAPSRELNVKVGPVQGGRFSGTVDSATPTSREATP
jgi:hypothetical protein